MIYCLMVANDNTYRLLEGAIELVVKSRKPQGLGTRPNLTLQDFFYREVTCSRLGNSLLAYVHVYTVGVTY